MSSTWGTAQPLRPPDGRKVRVRRTRKTARTERDVDLRTPSGKPLPY